MTEDLIMVNFIYQHKINLLNETIIGNTSNAQAVINDYRPNPVNTIQDLTNFRDPDKVISIS